MQQMLATLSSCLLPRTTRSPQSPREFSNFDPSPANDYIIMVRRWRKPGCRAVFDGNFSRQKLTLAALEYCIWATELPGAGLRVRPAGHCCGSSAFGIAASIGGSRAAVLTM